MQKVKLASGNINVLLSAATNKEVLFYGNEEYVLAESKKTLTKPRKVEEIDMAEKNMIKIYVDASSAKRVDIIIKHYTDFMGIVDGYTEGLRYMIECEKESNSHRELGDLGVRVQTGGTTSDPTAKKAIRNVMTREAIINCDFSGDVMDGVDRAEEFMRDAYLLRDMRKDYDLFNRQLSILGTEKETFEKYLRREKTLIDIAEEQGITYESAQQKIHRIRRKVKKQVVGFMDGKMGGIA